LKAHDNPPRFTNASPHRSLNRLELCSTHQSLSKNTVHRYQETPFNLTYASAPLLHHFFTRRVGGHRATLNGWAR
jgi:hypothetical protein